MQPLWRTGFRDVCSGSVLFKKLLKYNAVLTWNYSLQVSELAAFSAPRPAVELSPETSLTSGNFWPGE